MNTFKLAAFAIVTVLTAAMAFAGKSAGLQRKRVKCSVNFQTIDKFLAKSRSYLDL